MGGLASKTDALKATLTFEREAYRSSPVRGTILAEAVWSCGLDSVP